MPFGEKYHRDYQAAIGEISGERASWKEWLHEEYGVTLKYEIARRNRVEDLIKLPSSKVRLRLPDFISGKSDELN